MSYATLIAALPGDIAALSASALPSVLIDAAADSYVADVRRAAVDATAEAWWKPVGEETVDVTGQTLVRRRFELRIFAAGGTRAALETWHPVLVGAYHGRCRPSSVTALIAAEVEAFSIQAGPGPDVELLAVISFLMEA